VQTAVIGRSIELMPLQPCPEYFTKHLTENPADSKYFRRNISYCNNAFTFVSQKMREACQGQAWLHLVFV
jgi:hypothetical protein